MKVVIADDEILTLQLLEKVIDWNSFGLEISGMAMNGREAKAIIESCSPDILVTDIKMPEMDGLELIKWAKCCNRNMKIIILSAYGEFEFAQRALEYGANGYLLKPLEEEKLTELILKSINEISGDRLRTNNLSDDRISIDRINRNYLSENAANEDKLKSNNSSESDVIAKMSSGPRDKESGRYIRKAKEYINENYNLNITLEDICDYITVSKNYFCYLFKREMGENIWDYLTKVRVQKAQQLLKETDLKNYEISFLVGYENPSYFTKTFKRLTNLTPQEYRDI